MKNAKVLSALGLMSLASTAALAAGGPTLGSVLDASGVKVSGNLAVSLNQNVSVRGGSDQARSNFQVDQGLLSIAYQPNQGFGGVVDIATGTSVAGQGGGFADQTATSTSCTVDPATGECDPTAAPVGFLTTTTITPSKQTSTAVTQAYIQYKSGDLTVIGGRFYTAAGYEVFRADSNLFVTRSQTFGLESTYHTGVRATYAVSDALSVFGGLNNGVSANGNDSEASTLKNRGVELGVNWSPVKDLALALTTYHGKLTNAAAVDVLGPTHNQASSQNLYSFTASYKVTGDLNVAVNIDQGNTDSSGAANANKYTAYAGYVTYALSDATTLGLRLEEISARRQAGLDNNTGAVAAVLSHSFAKNFDLRTELSDVDQQANDDRQVKLAVQGVLKF